MRPELSKKNQYWIDKHRYYELKYLCLQYPNWKQEYADLQNSTVQTIISNTKVSSNLISDITAKNALKRAYIYEKTNMIEYAARKTDPALYNYILVGVTEGKTYSYLRSVMNIPCGRDAYYDCYRRFFWILSNLKIYKGELTNV